MKKLKLVTGKVDSEEVKDLNDILGFKKVSKFAKYASRDEYKTALYGMNHVDLCDEVMRLGEAPSCEARICREKCLAIFDRAQNPRKITYPDVVSEELEDVIARGAKKPVKKEEPVKPSKPTKTKKVKKD